MPIASDSLKSNPKAAEACTMFGVSTSSDVRRSVKLTALLKHTELQNRMNDGKAHKVIHGWTSAKQMAGIGDRDRIMIRGHLKTLRELIKCPRDKAVHAQAVSPFMMQYTSGSEQIGRQQHHHNMAKYVTLAWFTATASRRRKRKKYTVIFYMDLYLPL